MRRSVCTSVFSTPLSDGCANIMMMISLSTLVWKTSPWSSSSSRSCGGVGEVAVVGDGDLAARAIHRERLGVAEIGRAGGGITRVADGHVADEVVQDFAD